MSKKLEKIRQDIEIYLECMSDRTGRKPMQIGLYPKQYELVKGELSKGVNCGAFHWEQNQLMFRGIPLTRIG